MNRRNFLQFVGCGCLSIGITSCTTAPITERKQLKLISESKLNAKAAKIYEKIKQNEKKAGIALTMETKPEEIETLLKKVDYVLLLTIPKPGSSGQKFDTMGLDRIKQINDLSFRNQFILCIDGGVNENIVDALKAENIVSGSSVLNNVDPKRQIMRLQTVGRYATA